MSNRSQRPIAYASKTLSSTERSYFQIEREALSLLFDVRKFHQFLFGRKFTLVMDYKPFLVVLEPKSHFQTVSASRLHSRTIALLAYDFELKFWPTEAHMNADFLSRNPLRVIDDPCLASNEHIAVLNNIVATLESTDTWPTKFQDIHKESLHDKELCELMRPVHLGWPDSCYRSSPLYPYYIKHTELTISHGRLFLNMGVVNTYIIKIKSAERIARVHTWVLFV